MGPLEGLLVVDFSRVLAGPLAAMTLGDLGADVVKVERPGAGDDTRAWGPPHAPDGTSTYYLSVNRNKRGAALDLADPRALALARRADVLVENFTPGTMERFGLGYEDLRAQNPRLVYASITGFGRAAPAPGYDFLIQALGGLMSITGAPDGPPTKVGVALVDVLAGQQLTSGILAALYARERTGRGQRVEVSLLGSLLAALVNQASAVLNAGVVPGRMGNRHPSIAPYETYPAADGDLVVAVGNDAQFERLRVALGLPADPRFATNAGRVEHRAALAEAMGGVLRTKPVAHWLETLDVPCGAVNTVAEAIALAERLGLAPVVDLAGRKSIASPIGLSQTPVSYRLAPPDLEGPAEGAGLPSQLA